MSDVSTWSTTANENNAASPNGFPENMPPSGVNDSCREVMAAVKRADAENAKLSGATFTGLVNLSAGANMGGFKITGLAAGTSPGDALRYEQGAKLAGDTFTGLVNLAAGADIASAATIDLTAATGNCPRITGTVATSAVTMNTGQQMVVVADGAWPLLYNATTNNINTGGGNYTCAAGDIIFYHKDASGVVHGEIIRAAGVPVIYETGTWTCTLYDAITGGNASPTTGTGHYRKIGNIVFATIDTIQNISTTGMTSGNTLYISLPFVCSELSCGTISLSEFTYPAGAVSASIVVAATSTRAALRGCASGQATTIFTVGSISTGVSDIQECSITYVTT